MATKLPYLNVLEVESVNKDEVSRAIVIDKDEYIKALDIEQITTYQGLSNKPKINGVELNGDISLDELNVASKNDLNKVISDLDEVTSTIPTTENIQDKIDNSLMDYPTKSEVTTEINEKISNKADKNEIPTKVSQLENDKGYLTTIPSEYVTETELNNKDYVSNDVLIGKNYATKPELNKVISDLNLYYTKTESDEKYQLKGDYLTEIPSEYITESELNDKGYLTSIPSEYVTESELNDRGYLTSIPSEYVTESELKDKGYLTEIPSEYITESELKDRNYATEQWVEDKGYLNTSEVDKKIEDALTTGIDLSDYYTKQQIDDKGFVTNETLVDKDYATKTELNEAVSNIDLSEYYTKTQSDEKYQPKGNYLTSIPSEYITETELNTKDFATNSYVDDEIDKVNTALSSEIDNKQDTLVSGNNIKTINGISLLGNGNIVITGSEEGETVDLSDYYTKGEVDNLIDNIDVDLTGYATEQWVESKGYLTSIPSEYVTEDELNGKNYATKTEVANKQDKLISGTNIKTVNGSSILGSGNIEVAGGGDLSNYYTKTEIDSKGYLTSIPSEYVTETELSAKNYATTTALNNKQDKLTTGDNISITDNVISWEAPDIQVVNNIFTDNQSLKYTVSDFNGTSTEKTFPVATQTSAGLMSVADKTKLDNLDESGGSGGSIPYLKVGLISIVSGDFTAVYNAIRNNQPYFLQVTWSAGEAFGYFVNPETVWASNNTIYCTNQEHKNDGTYNFHSWVITAETVTITSDTDNAIPFMQVNNNEIVSGTFEEVYSAVKYNHPFFIKLYITGTTDYWGDPEMTRIVGNNLECWSTYHPVDGSYTQVMWTITPDGTVTKRVWDLNLVSTESYSTSTSAVEKIVTLTQDEYDALSEYDSTVLYLIV